MLYSNRDYAISIYSGTSVLVDWSHVWLTKNYGFRPEFRFPHCSIHVSIGIGLAQGIYCFFVLFL